ncbi:MAG TPA: fructose-1,6-bisphosphatase [Anaerolineae bacterium]|nr:fructose-1,6-bisphosphatase [Anaerolineae bacterium]HMR64810.1 fructose-1,6-bisphosphatase [Anaerolineae bacterium]
MEQVEKNLHYLQLLAKQYSSIQAASTEIINLNAILNLPKGTEHFISDVHGEYEAFLHVLRNGSGSIKRKIDDIFTDTLPERTKRTLATLIYYPERKLPLLLRDVDDEHEWYRITLFRLVKVCRVVSSKYTRSKVRKALPKDFAYIIEELLHEQESLENKQDYYRSVINTIISTGRAHAFIIALSRVIQRLAIDHLHIIGDVYDRGPGAHIIMDRLTEYHSLDFQWGNHDIVWMGAAAGSEACIANVIRICLRYSNMTTLEDGYAISMMPLATFAMNVYADDPCTQFRPKKSDEKEYTEYELNLMAKMHKAISLIQFKLESQIILRQPEYQMQDRLLLDKIKLEPGKICLNGREYPLNDKNFPTLDPDHPFALSPDERDVVEKLKLSFSNSDRLQAHVRFLYSKGSMYLIYNNNLLYHGCIVMNEDGSFATFKYQGETYKTRQTLDMIDRLARQAYFATDDPEQQQNGLDMMWYLWCGPKSPLFAKSKMATFERYFINDKETHKEEKNAYYIFRDQEETACRILEEFGLDPATAHILNGHVPVKVKKGESPIKAGGKLLVIDGGFSKAYQKETGIAGYTLVFNSYGLLLASHEPFVSTQTAIEQEMDIHSEMRILEHNRARIRIKDTDLGKNIQQSIEELQLLLKAYRDGLIKEATT